MGFPVYSNEDFGSHQRLDLVALAVPHHYLRSSHDVLWSYRSPTLVVAAAPQIDPSSRVGLSDTSLLAQHTTATPTYLWKEILKLLS